MTDTTSFALTRLQPPRLPAACIERGPLQARLLAAVHGQPLVLLCAPAGFGKTTALVQLRAALPQDLALIWIGAEEGDTLARSLAALSAVLAPLRLPWSVAPEALGTLAQADRGLRRVADVLINALGAWPARGLIVIDDAHHIADPRVFELLQLMLERLPPSWCLLLASRTEPPLALARQRVLGALAEFRQADLQFQPEEVQRLLALRAPDAAQAEQVQRLLAQTQGWAAGLSLCLAAWRSPQRAGLTQRAQRHLFDFLADEVLAGMPERLRLFLLRSALLPELTAARCAQLSGMDDAPQLLEEVERRGLFVSVVGERPLSLRLHDLFRDFLEERLARELPDELPALLRRAAGGEPELGRAIAWLVRADDWQQALGLLLQRGMGLLARGAAGELEGLLALFPAEQWQAHPDLWLLKGLCAWPRYDFDQLRLAMRAALDGYQRDGRPHEAALASAHLSAGLQHAGQFEEGSEILARLNAMPIEDPAALAFVRYGGACDAIVCGRPDEVAPRLAEMLAALQRLPDFGQWLSCPLQVMLLGAPGTAAQMGRHADAILARAGSHPNPLRASAWHVRCWQALLAGRLEEAADWLARADADCRWLGLPRLLQTDNLLSHLLLHALRGEREDCAEAGRALLEDIRRASPAHRRVHEPAMLFALARAAWLLQDGAALADWVAQLALARHAHEWPSGRGGHALAQALLALHEQRWDEAATLLATVDERLRCHFMAPWPQVLGLRAWLAARTGDLPRAAAQLAPLLEPGADSEAGALVFVGAPVLAALAGEDWGSLLSLAARQRLAGLAQLGNTAALMPTPVAPPSPPQAGLTPREREVLERIATGESNKLIARALQLSEHTVKQHVASILGKLGVGNRNQAAAWLRRS